MITTTNPPAATVKLSRIVAGDNVREDVGDVSELAKSIAEVGLLQPLVVSGELAGNGPLELIAGFRRLAALQKLKATEALALTIGADVDEGGQLARQLVENLQREDLTSIEEARGLEALVALTGSQKAAAKAVGRSTAHVSKRLALLKLPPAAHVAITEGELSLEDAAELAKVDDPKAIAKIVDDFMTNGHRYARHTLRGAVAKADDDREREAEARKLSKDHAFPIVGSKPSKAHALEGFAGLAVDLDEHLAEPCHLGVVEHENTWDTATPLRVAPYCSDPSRHDPDGESSVKVVTTTEDAERARRKAESEAAHARKARQLDARRSALAASVSGFTNRNDALKALATAVLAERLTEVNLLVETLTAVGVQLPDAPSHDRTWEPDWRQYVETIEAETIPALSIAQLYRAALYAVGVDVLASIQWNDVRTPSRTAVLGLLGLDLEAIDAEAAAASS